MKGQPVEFEGTVLCFDPGWGQLYVHDGVHAIYLSPRSFTNQFQPGQRVKIRGITTWDGTVPILTNTTAIVTDQQLLPHAEPLRLTELAKSYGQWIEITGKVRVAEASRERVTLMLEEEGRKCLVYVMQTSSTNQFRPLADCRVRIQGINASRVRDGKLEAGILFCPGLAQIKVLLREPQDRWQMPVASIETLLSKKLGSWTNQPVRIAGLVSAYQPGQTITIKDPTGLMIAEIIQVTPVQLYQRVDLWGFVSIATNGVALGDSYFEIASHPAAEVQHQTQPLVADTNQTLLTDIKQVRFLPKERANLRLPVRVRGVMTYVDSDWRVCFMQDGEDAIFLDCGQGDLRAGQYVEVSGQTDGSGFVPQLINCSAKVLGATNWPEPLKADPQDSVNGQLDSRWVEMRGVVRRVSKEGGRVSLALVGMGGRFTAGVLDLSTNDAPTGLVDSLVKVRGACGSTVNSSGQISGITLHVPRLEDITLLNRGPADPFDITVTPISQVATFKPDRVAGRRIRVAGVVTLAVPGQGLFLQDETGGIRIVGDRTAGFLSGERLDVLAFPVLGDFSPCLEEATIRRIGTTNLPTDKTATAERILQDGTHDGVRVELKAQVLQSHLQSAQPKLLLQDGQIIFTAQMVQANRQMTFPDLNVGSIVKICGVCVIQGTENNEPGSFRLLFGSPQDILLLQTGTWWTPRHTYIVLASIALAALLASIWVFSMRRQIRIQTQIIRRNQRELLETSRQAGMAEVATSVLHNVGNVLNSVNVSATLISDRMKRSRSLDIRRVAEMLRLRLADLGEFLTHDPKGQQVVPVLERLGELIGQEHASQLAELETLRKNVDHIKIIVGMQQSYGRVSGVTEQLKVTELVEDALQLNQGALERHRVRIHRDYQDHLPIITVERHKVLQILVNLICNAKNALAESDAKEKRITLSVRNGSNQVSIAVADNGIGIAKENLERIFTLGFTTRKSGHGFGLHSGALAAKELGGQLLVASEGTGLGATFTLCLPLSPPKQ